MATAEQTVSAVLQNLGTDNIIDVDDRLDTEGCRIERFVSGLMKIYSLSNGTEDTESKEITFPASFAEIPLVFLQRTTATSAEANYKYFVPQTVSTTGFTRAESSGTGSTYAYLAIGRAQ